MRRFSSLAALTLAAASCAALVAACSADDRARNAPAGVNAAPGSVALADAPLDAKGTIAQIEKLAGGAGIDVGHGRTLAAQAGALRLSTATAGAATRALTVALPARSAGAQRLEIGAASSGLWLELTPDAGDVAGSVVDGAVVYRRALIDTDLVVVAGERHAEELRVARSAAAPTTARWRVKTGPGARELRVREGRVELVDPSGRVRLAASKMVTIDAKGVRRSVDVALRGAGEARELVATWSTKDVAWPLVIDPIWSSDAGPNEPRTDHAALLLPNGKLMIYGGHTPDAVNRIDLATAEIYDPNANTWTTTATHPSWPAPHPQLALVDVGGGVMRVLAAHDDVLPPLGYDLYDWSTDKWTPTGKPTADHAGGALLPLPGGKLLAVGGSANGTGMNATSVAEVFDPTKGTWSLVDPMAMPRAAFGAVVLKDGKILVLGGATTHDPADPMPLFEEPYALSSAEVFDSTAVPTKQWTPAPSMAIPRYQFTATVLDDYSVLAVGGLSVDLAGAKVVRPPSFLSSTERLDENVAPALQAWTPGPTLALARTGHTANLLNGRLFVIGGASGRDFTSPTGFVVTARAEVFDPLTLTATAFGPWSLAGSGAAARLGHTATLDATKTKLFLVGGLPQGTSATEDFKQAANGEICSSANDCATGNCVDGVCCDKPCAGKCQTCIGSGAKGTCKDVTGPDPRGTCGDPACVSSCNAGACVFKDASTSCGSPNCYGSTLTPPGRCLGTDGVCVGGIPRVCAGNVKCADATSCKAKCASDADCAAGLCDLTNGTCSFAVDGGVSDAADAAPPEFDATPPKLTTGVKHCTQPSDCSTGFCVDGVCCDAACADRCHSCVLPSSPGHCALEPIGVDLRHECGPALSCLGTCGAEGNCAVAQKGTTCAPSRCVTASTGLGPAACSAAGAKCPTDDSIAFDCAPYTCEQAVGACLTTCETSADCVNGTICDATSHVCAVPPPPPSSGGCSYGPTTPGGGTTRFGAGMLAFLAIALFAARRRARAALTAGTLGAVGAAAALAGCSSKRELADVDAGAAQPAPAIAIAPAKASLVSELQARPRIGATIAARTAVTRDGTAFRFTTRKAHTGRLEARLSADARTLTLADSAAPEAWVELVAQDRAALSAHVEENAVVARGGARDVLLVGGDDHVEEIQVARSGDASSLRYALRRGPGVTSVRVARDRIEVLDRIGAVRLRSDAPYAVDARGTVRAMHASLEGDALTFTLDAAGLVAPIALDPGWSSGQPMLTPRMDHTATRLADGRVLVAGGSAGSVATSGDLTSCEIYDPKTGTWTDPMTAMHSPRRSHRAVLLDNGKVLVVGGSSGGPAELFDPADNSWTQFVGTPAPSAGGAPAVLKLADGRVLIAGGAIMVPLPEAYLYDPKAIAGSEFTQVNLPAPRDGAAAAFLPDGAAMVVGGVGPTAGVTMASQILAFGATPVWNGANGFTPTRGGISAFSTATGLLVLGGWSGSDIPVPYAYDFASKAWSNAPAPASLRFNTTITRLDLATKTTSPRIMVSGGTSNDGTVSATVELYDLTTKTWSTGSPLDVPRVGHTVTQLADGTTLITGGTTDGMTPLTTAQAFVAIGVGASCMAGGDCASGFCVALPGSKSKICCATDCAADSGCKPDGSACDTPLGQSCVADAECAAGSFCANGVCCNRKCDGLCEACNLSGSIGKCSSLGETCLGEPADAAVPPTDAGADGGPPTVHEAFTRCTKDAQCGTNHCVEGICCDTACTDRCHSCALSGTIGKCTVEPTGVDLKHECGPGRACLGTCSAGACVGSAAGTQCDSQKCTGPSTGIGPATCEKAGGNCQTDKVAPFDCSPYVCEPAFGACRETCTQSDECAQGYSCDTPTQKCVVNPPAGGGDGGGCVLGNAGTGAGAGSFALALGVAALGLAARRRRAA